MERRREVRFRSCQEARITLLGDQPVEMRGEVENLSPAGARLRLEKPLPLNAPVKVELEEAVLLGEVCYVQPARERFAVGLAVDQVLHRTPELARLVRALGGRRPEPASGEAHSPRRAVPAEDGASPETR